MDPKGRNGQTLPKVRTMGKDYNKDLYVDIKIRLPNLRMRRHGLASLRTADRDRLGSAV